MKILQENDSTHISTQPLTKRNISNIFDLSIIKRELESTYDIPVVFSSKRYWSDDIWYMTITAPYIGKVRDIVNPPRGTVVALFVDYDEDIAFAMPRSGADKTTMMLIASIANKHINKPFRCDSSLRNKLHSGGNKYD